MLTAVADPDADLEGALADWRRSRRRKRLRDVHWIDALYQAYVTALVSAVAVGVIAGLVSGERITGDQLDRLLRHGDAWLGLVPAVIVAIGLRSGSRGGPLALDRSDVRHVLMSPVDRTTAMRGPALRQLRFFAFVAVVGGMIAGNFAASRLPGNRAAWLACGALFLLTSLLLGYGAALVANGLRAPRWAASLLGLVLVVLAVLAGAGVVSASPATALGRVALWPVRFDVLGVVPIGVALVVLAWGLGLVGNVSLEAAERRSTLVGQLRFAATLQDLRTVLVLRRQLAMELPRLRPWIRLKARPGQRLPVLRRGLQGFLRWPAARVARTVILAAVAGAALRAAWAGTVPVVVLAGLALFIAGLDAVEPLAQEVDHPTRRDAAPMEAAELHLKHVPASVVVGLLVAAIAGGVAAVPGPGRLPGALAAVMVVPMALGAVGGALVSVLSGGIGGPQSDTWNVMPPEVAGMRVAVRTGWPPTVAVAGALPILAARASEHNGQPAASGAAGAAIGVALLFTLIVGWVRVRDQVKEWWRVQMSLASPTAPKAEEAAGG